MSGLIPGLADWALRGGAGNANNNADDSDNNQQTASSEDGPSLNPVSEEEMRARRLARMEALQQQAAAPSSQDPAPMEVEKTDTPGKGAKAMDTSIESSSSSPSAGRKSPPASIHLNRGSTDESSSKKAKESPMEPTLPSPVFSDPVKRAQRKRELLLKKVLGISLAGTSTASDAACVVIDTGATDITAGTIAEILATRLSLPKDAAELQTMPLQKPLLMYLATAHRKSGEELKSLQQNKRDTAEAEEFVAEIQRQVVSYAASCLMEPDLFEQASDGADQLAQALINPTGDISQSITFGVSGASTSFYYLLCEELFSQDSRAFQSVVGKAAEVLLEKLKKCDSVDAGVAEASPLTLVGALTSLASHKKAALALTQLPGFLLPEAGTVEAVQMIRPPMPTGTNGADLLRMLSGEVGRPYAKRSGPALDKNTLLGNVLKVGTPKMNPAFPPTNILRQSLDSLERTTSSQRQQLKNYQELCYQLVMSLIKGGPDARGKVMNWFADCLLVNTKATAMRPDPTKVSCTQLLLNTQVVLLRLCEPFVNDEKKHKLIDPGFVSSQEAHGGVYDTRGDDAISRLGETRAALTAYNPKNSFVPQCFFYTARAMALGLAPGLSSHENLLRHISHIHWELNAQNRDLQSEPRFRAMISQQRSAEVSLFQEELVQDSLRFCNLMAKVLNTIDDSVLEQMPEFFVDNICDVLMGIAKLKAKLLRGLELRHIFQLVVKLLSAKYASMVKNYNLRAKLGDVLYEIYLPTGTGDRRDIPQSVACDPMAGGQTYLLSDKMAQETLAPSLLLLYGEVEHTGYYDKMSHRAKISSLLKYLWESSEHRPAFQAITDNKESFIKFANGIMNETNTLIATVMQKLPDIREAQEKMADPQQWGQLSEDEQQVISGRLEDSEREVKHALPLCNKTLQMFGYLNTDPKIRSLFLLDELCSRLVAMLLHVLTKLVGSKGLDLKVKNPEEYEFRPKEMLRDLCAIFALFASAEPFVVECAKSGCDPSLLRKAVSTCRRLNLLAGESLVAFENLPDKVADALVHVAEDEAMFEEAPDEFKDALLDTFMEDPVLLPSGHVVNRSTITQHLLNDPSDPFSRQSMTIDDIKPATELKAKIDQWVRQKRGG